ncbi:MAG: tetratricopeptide repeat protein [Clostridia bacterium]|nr:tetratricopeptide repeat protein [Clostridia bacterium]
MSDILEKEDYAEPACPFCTDAYKKEPPVKSIPIGRVIEKADEYFSRNDYLGAERHFLYWLDEAKEGRDLRGEFSIRNELLGLYRKIGKKEEGLKDAKEVLSLIEKLELSEEIAGGTAYVNIGTVYKTFGLFKEALDEFLKAQKIYEKELKPDDGRLGGLYNNMALVLVDLKRYKEARENFFKALVVMEKVENGELERAITYLNLVDLTAYEKGLEDGAEEIADYFEKAEKLLNTPKIPRNGYYAFVCEKCAGTFEYYGYFGFSEELKERAREIYERA